MNAHACLLVVEERIIDADRDLQGPMKEARRT